MKRLPTCIFFLIGMYISLHAAIIKVGDVLDIQVQGHQEFSGRYTVSMSGTIEYPLLADETIVNISTSELMNELTFRLAKHIGNSLVLISVVEKPNITVTVLGQVANAGPVETYLGSSVQEVIQLAGGPAPNANIDSIKIIHSDGNDQTAEFFNLKAFLKKGNFDNMPTMQPGDVVILLSETRTTKVKVIGAVNKPGFFDLDDKINVFELIYLAGGPAEKADLSRVRRFFKSKGKTLEEVINVQLFIDKGEMDKIPMVEEGDVVIIYARWFDWRILMSILTNVLLFIVTIQSLRGAVGGG
ncbi:MAG: polysaccharide export protein [Deltaproteobacteria bacterium]|nr:polysaccharide export protein [Deltaproteobacteria bacterium]